MSPPLRSNGRGVRPLHMPAGLFVCLFTGTAKLRCRYGTAAATSPQDDVPRCALCVRAQPQQRCSEAASARVRTGRRAVTGPMAVGTIRRQRRYPSGTRSQCTWHQSRADFWGSETPCARPCPSPSAPPAHVSTHSPREYSQYPMCTTDLARLHRPQLPNVSTHTLAGPSEC